MTTYTKTPSSVLDYAFDWTTYLTSVGSTVASLVLSLVGTGSIQSQIISGNVAKAFVSGGADGEVMELSCTLTTVSGLVDTRVDYIRVRTEALIVESGTGKEDAESYISIQFADMYLSDRTNSGWANLTTAAKNSALRQATDFLTQTYRQRWKGIRLFQNQALDWPRSSAIVEGYQVGLHSVPLGVKQACAELALRASVGKLSTDLKQQVLEKQIGPIKIKYDSQSNRQVRYEQINQMVAIYLDRSSVGVCVKLERT